MDKEIAIIAYNIWLSKEKPMNQSLDIWLEAESIYLDKFINSTEKNPLDIKIYHIYNKDNDHDIKYN